MTDAKWKTIGMYGIFLWNEHTPLDLIIDYWLQKEFLSKKTPCLTFSMDWNSFECPKCGMVYKQQFEHKDVLNCTCGIIFTFAGAGIIFDETTILEIIEILRSRTFDDNKNYDDLVKSIIPSREPWEMV